MRLSLGYPSAEGEARLLDVRPAQTELASLPSVLTAADVLKIQQAVDAVHLSGPVRQHIVAFARATREHESLRVGLSPRGSLALAQAARATAFMAARDHVIPEDVIDNITAVCAHRVIPTGTAGYGSWDAAADILRDVLTSVAAPL
jgi:MoxR-like ATPase